MVFPPTEGSAFPWGLPSSCPCVTVLSSPPHDRAGLAPQHPAPRQILNKQGFHGTSVTWFFTQPGFGAHTHAPPPTWKKMRRKPNPKSVLLKCLRLDVASSFTGNDKKTPHTSILFLFFFLIHLRESTCAQEG